MSGLPARVLVVGGGPAGMAATIALRRANVGVVLADRDVELGGVPRWTDHIGFGIRDTHRVTSGPRYAAGYARKVRASGAEVRCSTTVLDVADLSAVRSVSPAGPLVESFDAVLLATGVRERPRPARLVPGDRPAGVLTTGSLQHLVERGLPVGDRAVIVGAEHVSFSAVLTLRHAGCRPVAMLTESARHSTHPALRWATAGRYRVPVITGVGVGEVVGRGRVEAIVLTNGRRIACDTVVFTGDWIPDHELAVRSGVRLDPQTSGPSIGADLATNRTGIFAAGNLLRGARAADACALEGRLAARSIIDFLGRR